MVLKLGGKKQHKFIFSVFGGQKSEIKVSVGLTPTRSSAAGAAKLLQPCPALCNPIDGSPSGSSIPGILQARILEWVVISVPNVCMHTKLLQSYLTLCDPMDSSPPGSSIHRILQATILEWVAISFSTRALREDLFMLRLPLVAALSLVSLDFQRSNYNCCLYLHMAFSIQFYLCLSSSYGNVSHIRTHSNPLWLHLNLSTFAKTKCF